MASATAFEPDHVGKGEVEPRAREAGKVLDVGVGADEDASLEVGPEDPIHGRAQPLSEAGTGIGVPDEVVEVDAEVLGGGLLLRRSFGIASISRKRAAIHS